MAHLDDTSISCGIGQLYDVGGSSKANIKRKIEEAGTSLDPYAFLIASVTKKQRKARRRLKKFGFKRVTKWEKNPNSNNRIALFVKKLS